MICDICKRRFPGTGSLKKHIEKCIRERGNSNVPSAKLYIAKKSQRNCELKHKGGEKHFKCDVAGCDIGFFNRRSKKKHERQQHGDHVAQKTKYVSSKIKVVHT